MTQWSVKEEGLYYRPNTDHFFLKYRPITDQFSQYFPKIQTRIICVMPFFDQTANIVESRGKGSARVIAMKRLLHLLETNQHINISQK